MRRVLETAIAVMVCTLIGCGGSDTGVSRKEKADDGRVLVRNETGSLTADSREVEITVTYTDSDGRSQTTIVAAGEVKDVTGDVLIKGGERVSLTIESPQSEGTSSWFQQKVRIRTTPVDGNIEVRIIAVRDGQQLEGSGFEIE